jgi:hypothetical protein
MFTNLCCFTSQLMCSPCHIRCIEIFVQPRNFRRTWLFIYFFYLLLCQKKRRNRCGIFFFLITQPFLYLERLEGARKLISQEQFKKTTTNIFQVRQQFRGLTKISTHRIWHGEHIRLRIFNEEEKLTCYLGRSWFGFEFTKFLLFLFYRWSVISMYKQPHFEMFLFMLVPPKIHQNYAKKFAQFVANALKTVRIRIELWCPK